MKEHPILFSAPMVRALLANRKFVTRRLDARWMKVKAGDRLWVRETTESYPLPNILTGEPTNAICGRYSADQEPVLNEHGFDWSWWYSKPVCPNIHMPRWASRILLECEEDTRAEQLQDITEEEAEAEGCDGLEDGLECNFCGQWRGYEDSPGVQRADTADGEDWHFVCPTCGEILAHYPMDEMCRQHFRDLWDTLHGKPRYVKGAGFGGETLRVDDRWAENPTVYRVGRFHRVEAKLIAIRGIE